MGALLAARDARAGAFGVVVPPVGEVVRPGGASGPDDVVTRIDNPDKRVAITFDACATKTHGYGFDRAVYGILQKEKVPATIFVSGRWVEFHPEVMTELAADPLVEFGDHSYDHPHMSKLTVAQMGAEIDQTEELLARYGKKGVGFRPPFGDWSGRVVEVARVRGLPVILWDVVSGDPAAATTTRRIIDVVDRKTRAGSIIIFHINGRGRKTATALPTVLRDLRAHGFQPVPLSELLALRPAAAPSEGATAAAPAPAAVTAASPARKHDSHAPAPPGPMLCEPPAPWEHIVPESATGVEVPWP